MFLKNSHKLIMIDAGYMNFSHRFHIFKLSSLQVNPSIRTLNFIDLGYCWRGTNTYSENPPYSELSNHFAFFSVVVVINNCINTEMKTTLIYLK